MSRSLRNRPRALAKGREPNAVIEALAVIESTGTAPSTAAGDRAAALWQQATDLGVTERWLWCHLRATGLSIAELSEEALLGS